MKNSFFRATSTPTEALRKPVKVDLPSGDALLRSTPHTVFSSHTKPWSQVRTEWLAVIANEGLCDVETAYYRTPTEHAFGFNISPVNGEFFRRGVAGVAITPRAWRQLIALLNDTDDAPRSPAEAYGWLSPANRAEVFEELRDRSQRKEGSNHEILLRSFLFNGRATLRAVLTARHSGEHFDDAAVCNTLNELLSADAPAYVSRSVDYTHGYAVLAATPETNGARLALTWSNSETGAASLSFAGACHVTALNATLRADVTVAAASKRTRRSHTLPRVGYDHAQRSHVAHTRMSTDIDTALAASEELCAAWGVALKTFAPGTGALPQGTDRATVASLVLDSIEEQMGFQGTDRESLHGVLVSDALDSLPTLSTAHIAGAFAVLAREQTSFEEANRLQGLAAHWVLGGWA